MTTYAALAATLALILAVRTAFRVRRLEVAVAALEDFQAMNKAMRATLEALRAESNAERALRN